MKNLCKGIPSYVVGSKTNKSDVNIEKFRKWQKMPTAKRNEKWQEYRIDKIKRIRKKF